MTTGAVNNFKYPFAQPATGASAVSIQIFEPKAYTNTNPYIGKLPEGMESAYEIPEGNLYEPANAVNTATTANVVAQAQATQAQTTQTPAQATTTPAQFQLTPAALQETINAAVQLAASKAVAEAMAKINAQNVTMVQNNATQTAPDEAQTVEASAIQAPAAQMNAVETTPAPQVMPNSAIEETVPEVAQQVETKPAETTQATPTANVVATATVTVTPAAQEAQAVEAQAQAVEAPQVTEAQTDYKPVNIVDTNKIMEGLNSTDLDVQTQTIDAIAKMSQAESEIALQLVDDGLMAKLAQIAAVDTSKLEGPSKERLKIAEKVKKGKKITDAEQQILDTVSPKEVAVKNKVISMYTLALLQKLQRDEVENYNALQANSGNTIPNVQVGELVGFKEIVNEATNAQTPVVRKAALQSITYVLRADEADVAKELLAPFANDKDVEIQKIAKEALAAYGA